jgi:hypothetical protein
MADVERNAAKGNDTAETHLDAGYTEKGLIGPGHHRQARAGFDPASGWS